MATEEQFNQLLDKFSRIETRLAAIEAGPAVTEPEPVSADTIQPQGQGTTMSGTSVPPVPCS